MVYGLEGLRQFASEGRIQPEDYLFNPVLGKWLYAKDTAEVQDLFVRKDSAKDAGGLNSLSLAFGIGGIVLSLVPPLMPLGGLLILIGLVLTVAY